MDRAYGPDTHRSYDPSYFRSLFAIEDRHFWFRARSQVISALVSQIVADLPPGYRVLEAGCGGGGVLRVLEQTCAHGVVVGLDLFAEGLQYARQRTSCLLVQGDVLSLPFGTQFHLIGLFDLLEHLPDDIRVLRDLHKLLATGGTLLLTVPAHGSLWSYFDEASRHCRRYELAELEAKLMQTGYRLEYLTRYMASILPLVWLGRRLAALTHQHRPGDTDRIRDLASSELRIIPVVNDLLALMVAQEARFVARRRHMPVGASLVAVARKDLPSAG